MEQNVLLATNKGSREPIFDLCELLNISNIAFLDTYNKKLCKNAKYQSNNFLEIITKIEQGFCDILSEDPDLNPLFDIVQRLGHDFESCYGKFNNFILEVGSLLKQKI